MMNPSPSPEGLSAPPKIPEEDAGDLPVALSASVVLTSLPRDGRLALDKALNPKPTKVSIRFKAIGAAPILNKDVYKIKTNQRFENVVKFLRDSLGIPTSESIFTYINATFAPALDENVGNLYNVRELSSWSRKMMTLTADYDGWSGTFSVSKSMTSSLFRIAE